MATGFAGTLVFDVQHEPGQSKRRRQDYSYDKWKYRILPEVDPTANLKRQRTNNVKKVKERERRTRMAEAVQALRDTVPGAQTRKSNQIVVMTSAVEYIKKLEETVKALQQESDLFRAALAERGISLPPGVSPTKIQIDFEVASYMDESDSDLEERRQDDFESTSPNPNPLPAIPTPSLPEPPASLTPTSFTPIPDNTPPYTSSSPSASTPIPIPGTVGAPIRPHETRTRLERVTGSAQHLVNKNPRKQTPPRDTFMNSKESPSSPMAHHATFKIEEGYPHSEEMIEEMDFLNDIEEVGAWPLHPPSHPPGHSSGSSTTVPLLMNRALIPNGSPLNPLALHSLSRLSPSPSPYSQGKSVGTFSPKLVFIDSPTNLMAGESYAAYTNPFDSNF